MFAIGHGLYIIQRAHADANRIAGRLILGSNKNGLQRFVPSGLFRYCKKKTTGFTATTKKEQPIFLWDSENGPSLNRELKLPMLLETGIQSSCFEYPIHINVLQRKYVG